MPKWPRHPTVFEINTWVWLAVVFAMMLAAPPLS
jgi:hypothetical protein